MSTPGILDDSMTAKLMKQRKDKRNSSLYTYHRSFCVIPTLYLNTFYCKVQGYGERCKYFAGNENLINIFC